MKTRDYIRGYKEGLRDARSNSRRNFRDEMSTMCKVTVTYTDDTTTDFNINTQDPLNLIDGGFEFSLPKKTNIKAINIEAMDMWHGRV